MTRQELVNFIQGNIYPNGRNQITAPMVRDSVLSIVSFMGDAATLNIGAVAQNNPGVVTGGAVFSAINSALSSAIKFVGITTTVISDGSTQSTILIDGDYYTAERGDEVIYGGKEYLWIGTKWQQLGDEESWALKTISITGTGYLTGGGTLEQNRTIDITSTIKDYIDHGEAAYNALPALSNRITTLEKMFIDDTYTEGGQTKHRLKVNPTYFQGIITEGFLNAASDGGVPSGGGGGLIERLWEVADLSSTLSDFDNNANDTFNAYTINSLHVRILDLEQHPGGVTSVAGLTGAVSAANLLTALGLSALSGYGVASSVVSGDTTHLVTGAAVHTAINNALSSVMQFEGVSSTEITDGGTETPTIGGVQVTPYKGMVVLYGAKEFVWTGSNWEVLGDEASWALKTTQVIAGTGLSGGGQLTSNVTLSLAASGVTAGTYKSVTVDTYGRVTAGSNPTTLAGYGITDAVPSSRKVNNHALSADITLSLDDVADGSTRKLSDYLTVADFGKMFIDDTYTEGGQTKHRLKVNPAYFQGIITEGFLIGAADGGPGGGGGGGIDLNAMWASLQNTTPDTHATDKFHKNHLPAIVASDGISAGYTLDSGNLATHLNIGISAIDQSKVSGLATALSGKVNKAGDTMTGRLRNTGHIIIGADFSTYASNRAELDVVTVADDACDIWLGSNNARQWYISARPSNEYYKVFIGHTNFGAVIIADPNGNVGIGTHSTGTYKLNVGGSFNATTIYQNGTALGSNAFSSTAYLPLSGGTLSLGTIGSFVIKKTSNALSYIRYSGLVNNADTILGHLGFNGVNSPSVMLNDESTEYLLLHSGNYSNYALPLSAGTSYPLTGVLQINANSDIPLIVNNNSSAGATYVDFRNTSGRLGFLIADENGTLKWGNSNLTTVRTIYHSGNSNKSDVAWTAEQLHIGSKTIGELCAYIYLGTSPNRLEIQPSLYGSSTRADLALCASGGNVGIGTASPSFKLDVRATSSWAGYFGNTASYVVLSNYEGFGIGINSTANTANQYLLYASKNQSTLGTGGDMAFIVRADGYVGIGTEYPSYKLDVAGQARVSSNFYAPIHLINSTGTSSLMMGSNYTGSLSANDLVLAANNGSNHLWVRTNTMNIGSSLTIGYNLHVAGTTRISHRLCIGYDTGDWDASRAEFELISPGENANDLWMGTNNTRVWCLSSRSSGEGYGLSLYGGFHTGSTFTAAYFTASGNLGIGTPFPSCKLDVAGVIHATTGVISEGYGNFASSYSSSDQRLKDDITEIEPEYALEKLMSLRPCEWVWNERSTQAGKKGAGFIAQQVSPFFGFTVAQFGEYMSINYDNYHGYEVSGIKGLYKMVKELKKEVSAQAEEIRILRSENAKLKERINA